MLQQIRVGHVIFRSETRAGSTTTLQNKKWAGGFIQQLPH